MKVNKHKPPFPPNVVLLAAMEFILKMGQKEPGLVLLKIFNYLDNKSAIRFAQVNRPAQKKLADKHQVFFIDEFKEAFKMSCASCRSTLIRVLNGSRLEMKSCAELYIRWKNEGSKKTKCFLVFNLAYPSGYHYIEMVARISNFHQARQMVWENLCYYLHRPIKEGRYIHFSNIVRLFSPAEMGYLASLMCWEFGCHDDVDQRNLFQIVGSSNDTRFLAFFLANNILPLH